MNLIYPCRRGEFYLSGVFELTLRLRNCESSLHSAILWQSVPMSDFPMQIAFLPTENHLIMCSEAAKEPSPNVLHSLMSYNFKKVGGF